jgi:hypothetical protein
MKKFTNIGEENNSLNENNSNQDFSNISLEELLKTLSIEIDGNEEADVTVDYKVKATDKFFEGLKTIVNEMYHEEKIALLEKARINQYLNNVAWIDDEMDSIKESIENKNDK